ncbi:Bug family tripartite tricarboxylate transporter substrate binding protein [Pseudorhodoferax soli]|uniref:Tripartite-type tricarboxylate transporter receptor subunit TctC n=1 Tax=Pseudorhodoferax soli TaxID=545864 RepID=A0A368XNH4_9BURK|nr:tripartite tricarboxylate transporter substrate binding protein [Pseudorhodoferax soli]RCW68568.1 tripartite-type tricarboxylate transporter receptor subunit TctC [Pseudorhodoferax soli]
MKIRSCLAASLCLLAMATTALHAQTKPWPTEKPITWIVGFAPGGTLDVLTRAVAKRIAERTGQSVVVDNRPGATGAIAQQAVARAAPDGYTVISLAGPILTAQTPPQVGKELAAVAMLGQGPMVLVGPASSPITTLQDLIKDAKSNPHRWSYGSSGTGVSQHLAGELLKSSAGISMTHIPYKGGGQAVTDVVGGQIPLALLGVSPVLPHIKSGRLRAYGVTTAQHADALPGVPTFQEAGVNGYDASQWYAAAVPAGTPADRIAQLNALINEAVTSAEVAAVLQAGANNAVVTTPTQARDFVVNENKRWRALATATKMDLE